MAKSRTPDKKRPAQPADRPGPKAARPAPSWLGRHTRLAAITLVVVALAAAWGGWHYLGHRRIEGIRNVVLISIDTCRADRLSCYGYKRLSTPSIDAVAREGVLFRNVLTPVPMTTPAHSSMLTGTYPPTHGVRLNNGERLAASNVTLAEVLQKAGFRTGAFVGGFPLDAQFGFNQGFDTYDGQFARSAANAKARHERPAEEVNAQALAWLDKNGEKPFFLFLHYYDAHLPYEPPMPYAANFADDLYAGEIAHVDHCIGQVLDRLRATGAYDNTLVIITGDHGEGLGEHGEGAHAFFIYESTLHVPLVMHVPGLTGARQVNGNASLVDIVPTVLDLLALKSPALAQGVSLRASLAGGAAPARKQPVYAESMEPASLGASPLTGIVEGPWKYIRAPRQELYDLKADPGERNNLIDKEPAVARRLRGQLETMLPNMESAAAKQEHSTVDAEALKQLQGLGYVGAAAATPGAWAFDPALDDPKDLMATYDRLQKSLALFNSNRAREATKELLDIAAGRPKLVTAWALLAQIATTERRLDDAAGYCRHIVAILAESKDASKPIPAGVDLALGTLDTRNLATARCNLAVVLKELGQRTEAIEQYEQALRIAPDATEVRLNLAQLLRQAGKAAEAIGHFEQVVRQKPDLVAVLNNLAWVRATHADASLRNGPEAVRLAEYACQLTGRKELGLLDTLAAAYAEAGRFPDAVATAQEALALASPQIAPGVIQGVQERLTLYKSGRAFHESPPVPAGSP